MHVPFVGSPFTSLRDLCGAVVAALGLPIEFAPLVSLATNGRLLLEPPFIVDRVVEERSEEIELSTLFSCGLLDVEILDAVASLFAK